MEMKIGGCFSTHSLYIWLEYDGISRSQYTSTWTTNSIKFFFVVSTIKLNFN
jgi:hypothetical protein